MTKFAKEFRTHRRACKFTQADIAVLVDVTPQAVKYWEKARNFPNFRHIELINKVFSANVFTDTVMLMHYYNKRR